MNIISDSFSYAFRRSGKYMLLAGAILSVIASIASIAPVFGIFAYVFLSGYFCATYFSLIESTAVGDSEAPSFPDVSNILEDLLWPLVKVILVACFSFAPYIGYGSFGGGFDDLTSNVLLIVGVVYFPMAMLAVVVLGYIGALSPHIVIPGILKAGWHYWFAVVLLYVIYTAKTVLSDSLMGMPFLGVLVMGFVGMYVLMTSGRILGLVYKNREEELNWL